VDFRTVADNLRESFRVVAGSRKVGEIRELPGVSIASAGAAFQMFNTAFLSDPVDTEAELAQRVSLASVHYEVRGFEWAYWLCEDLLSPRARKRTNKIFDKHKLRHSAGLPAMAAERVLPPLRPLPLLEMRRVEPGPVRDAFCAIGSSCFHVPITWFSEVFDSPEVWKEFRSYVGYLNGTAVATTAIVRSDSVLGVYNVATVPEYRRRGYGEAIMRQALADAEAALGIRQTVLQSTPAGLRLYERMGFRTVGRISVYAS
jgi:ribosomal protein S18 acetylase RimI-like enzyme